MAGSNKYFFLVILGLTSLALQSFGQTNINNGNFPYPKNNGFSFPNQATQQWQPKPQLKDNIIIKAIGIPLAAITTFLSKYKIARMVILFLVLVPFLYFKSILQEKQQQLQMKGIYSFDGKAIMPKIRKVLYDLIQFVLDVTYVIRRNIVDHLPGQTQALLGLARFFGGGAISLQAILDEHAMVKKMMHLIFPHSKKYAPKKLYTPPPVGQAPPMPAFKPPTFPPPASSPWDNKKW